MSFQVKEVVFDRAKLHATSPTLQDTFFSNDGTKIFQYLLQAETNIDFLDQRFDEKLVILNSETLQKERQINFTDIFEQFAVCVNPKAK